MKVVLINPSVVGQINDYLGHIPYQPIGILHVAVSRRAAGVAVNVVDCFGESPGSYRVFNDVLAMHGL